MEQKEMYKIKIRTNEPEKFKALLKDTDNYKISKFKKYHFWIGLYDYKTIINYYTEESNLLDFIRYLATVGIVMEITIGILWIYEILTTGYIEID